MKTNAKIEDKVYSMVTEQQVAYYKKQLEIPYDFVQFGYERGGDMRELEDNMGRSASLLNGKKRVWFILYGAPKIYLTDDEGKNEKKIPIKELSVLKKVLDRFGTCNRQYIEEDRRAVFLYDFSTKISQSR